MASSTSLPVVLVHGYWHGTWCWSLVAEQLAGQGVPSVAVDMLGHGLNQQQPSARWQRPFDPGQFATEPAPSAGVTATAAAEHLVAQLGTIGRGRPCVLVAHSMGGTVATLAAEMAPELVAHLIYVTAFAPVSGAPAVAYIGRPENEGELVGGGLAADPAVVGALRYDVGDAGTRALLRQTFFNDVEDDLAAAAIALLGPDAPVGIAAEAFGVTPERWGSRPRTYVVCEQDFAIRPPLQRAMVAEMDAVTGTTEVVEFNSSHSPFLSMPGELAAVIAERSTRQG